MVEVHLPNFIITFDGQVVEIFGLKDNGLPLDAGHNLQNTRFHVVSIGNIEIESDKKGRHSLKLSSMWLIPVPDDKLSEVEELINAVNEAKASL